MFLESSALLLALLLAGCEVRGGAAPARRTASTPVETAIPADSFVALMRSMGDWMEAELLKGARGELDRDPEAARQAAARMSFFTSGRGDKARAIPPEILRQQNLTRAQVTAFIAAHPDIADRELRALDVRLDAVATRLASQLAAGEQRPAGRPPAPLAGWARVATVADLAASLDEDRPVIVYFGATYALPCRELERDVLGRSDVSARLAGYVRIQIDGGVETPATQQLTAAFDVQTLPAAFVYASSRPLQLHLRGKGPRPPPAFAVHSLVPAEQFLAGLPR